MRVDFQENVWDRKLRRMIEDHFSTKTIRERTGLTEGEIQYRRSQLRNQYGISVRAYANGESQVAKHALDRIDKMLGTCKSLRWQIDLNRRQAHRSAKGYNGQSTLARR